MNIAKFPVPDFVWEEYKQDQEINDRGIGVDMEMVKSAIAMDGRSRAELSAAMQELTELENPNSVQQMKQWLSENGMETDSLDKKAVAGLLQDAPEPLKTVLTLRQQLAKSSVKKVSREQGLSFDSVRQIKEKGLRRLRMGKAKRELLEKFDIAEAGLFRGGLNNYKEHNFTSIVEHLAEKRIEAEERYKRHLAEIEEMHRKRLVRNSEKPESKKYIAR